MYGYFVIVLFLAGIFFCGISQCSEATCNTITSECDKNIEMAKKLSKLCMKHEPDFSKHPRSLPPKVFPID